MKVFLMVLNSLEPSSMHIVQEKDMIYIKKEKCIIKKGILRKERNTKKRDRKNRKIR